MKYFYESEEINKNSKLSAVDHIILLEDKDEEILLMGSLYTPITLLRLVIIYFKYRQFYKEAEKLTLIDSKYQEILEKKLFEKNKLRKYRNDINEIITKKIKIVDIWSHGGIGSKGSSLFHRVHSLTDFQISPFEHEAIKAFRKLKVQ